MTKSRSLGWLSLFALVLVVSAPIAVDSSASGCTGTLFEYYETSACQVIVSAKVVCAGFPDQRDTDANGNYTETNFFTTETVVCPCSGGNGGSNGGADDTEDGG